MDANVKNRTDYFEISLGGDFVKQALDALIGFTAYVFWLAAAAPYPKRHAGWCEKRGAGGLSGVGGIGVHHERGAGLGRICVWPSLGVKRGKWSSSRLGPMKSRVS